MFGVKNPHRTKMSPELTGCQVSGCSCRSFHGRHRQLNVDNLKFQCSAHTSKNVFVDHFVCSTRGRKQPGSGIKKASSDTVYARANSYCGGCIFIDAATGYIDVQHQSFLSSDETIEAVTCFETRALDYGIIVKEYFSDNGSAFTSKSF